MFTMSSDHLRLHSLAMWYATVWPCPLFSFLPESVALANESVLKDQVNWGREIQYQHVET